MPENSDEGIYCDRCVEELYAKWWEIEKTAYENDEDSEEE